MVMATLWVKPYLDLYMTISLKKKKCSTTKTTLARTCLPWRGSKYRQYTKQWWGSLT